MSDVYLKYTFRPRLGVLPGINTVYYGEASEGCECVGKNRVTPYYHKPEEIHRLRCILAVLRRRRIDSTLAAIEVGLGPRGCAVFSLRAPYARKVLQQKSFQEALSKEMRLADLT